jgi:DNA-binding PadR family transcriptional regulator
MLQYNGRNNGRIDAIFTRLEKRGWKNGTLYRTLNELQEKGFIVKTRQGGIGAMKKICSLYRFTHLATLTDWEIGLRKSGPTNDFKTWKQEKIKYCSHSGNV